MNPIRILLSIALIALYPSFAYSREIKGRVISDNDSTSVAGAVCNLKTAEKQLSAVSTDADGRFSVATDIKETLRLEINMTGFDPTEIIIEKGNKNIDLGNIFLSEGTTLQNITVTADRSIVSKGRTIIFPSGADVKSSSTSLGLFQKLPLPGLTANPVNRSISVDGGSPVILINGVPSSMDEVNSLKPDEIEKIEYSRLTPARYADKGSSGFINIILKKRTDGGSVFIWGRSAVTTAFVDANVKASYHQGASEFSFFYQPSWRNYQQVFDNVEESYIGDDFHVNLEKHDRNPFNYFMNKFKLKYNYSPSLKTLFSATLNMNVLTSKARSFGDISDSVLGEYTENTANKSKEIAPSLDLYFRHDFNDKNSLEAQVVGTLSENDYNRENRYIYPDRPENSYIMDVDNHRRSLISEISYIHHFSDITTLSAGYQNTVSHSRNDYRTTDYRPILTENNNYVYVRLGQQIKKVYISLSTGMKMFWVKNDINRRHFIRNLTSFQASWNINRSWNLTGAFRYTPSIPSLSSLTDYPQQTTPYLISNGNPDLKVAEYFTYQIIPSFKYKKFSSSLNLLYSNAKNQTISDMFYLGDGKFLSQSVNTRKRNIYSGNLSLGISDIYGFGANVSMNLSRYYYAGADWSNHLTSFSANMYIWWNKGPFTISYGRNFPGKILNGHVVGKEENWDALSVQYKPDSHWTFGADWMYMFDTKGTKYPSWSYSKINPSVKERYIKHNGNMVVLSVSYTADFGSIFRSARRNLNNTDSGSSLLRM